MLEMAFVLYLPLGERGRDAQVVAVGGRGATTIPIATPMCLHSNARDEALNELYHRPGRTSVTGARVLDQIRHRYQLSGG